MSGAASARTLGAAARATLNDVTIVRESWTLAHDAGPPTQSRRR